MPANQRVAVCIPSGESWKAPMAFQATCLAIHSAPHVEVIPINVRGEDTAQGRNRLVRHAQRAGAGWLLWIDADMVFPPDSLVRLLAHNLDIVGADYRRRSSPFPRIGKPVEAPASRGLEEVSMLGLGLMLVRAGVLKRMGRPSFIRAWLLDQATPDNPSGFSTEDGYLCGHARFLGFKVYADLDLSADVGHLCEAPVPWGITAPDIPGMACLKSSA